MAAPCEEFESDLSRGKTEREIISQIGSVTVLDAGILLENFVRQKGFLDSRVSYGLQLRPHPLHLK